MNKISKNKIVFGTTATIAMLAIPIVATASCGNNETQKLDSTKQNSRAHFVMGNAWYTGSAEQRAMTKTEYKAAEAMFDKLKIQTKFETTKVDKATAAVKNTAANKSIPVVFMDIDETVMSNIAYQNYNVLNGKGFSPVTWDSWVQSQKAAKIAGAIDFIKHVWGNGGVVMYNSDRKQFGQKDATVKNLIANGLDKKYLPDWAFWMQGIDETKDKPWLSNKNSHTHKEARMDAMNNHATYDLSNDKAVSGSGDKVSLKTVMRIGDNFNDFNDYATKHKTNKERREVFKNHLQDNFGSTNTPGKIYNAKTNTWSEEAWNEGYVQIGGNTSYGGWEEGLKEGYYKLKLKDQLKAQLDGLKAMPVWDGTKTWDGK